MSVGRGASLARIGAVYVVALAVAAAWLASGPDTAWLLLDTLLADLLATLVVFAGSRILRSSSTYDAYWSVAPPLIATYWWLSAGADGDPVRFALVAVVIGLWAVRLTWNWAHLFPDLHHEDWRYPMLRDKAGRLEAVVDLMAIHVFPTLQAFAALLPVYAVTRSGGPVGLLDGAAFVLGVVAVALQLVSDTQMQRFAATKQPGDVMDRGLWGWSRHPNYLGELCFWLSLALFGLAASPSDWWWVLPGFVTMTAMFLGASIPMMEQRSLERRPSYAEVVERVPMLLPRPPRGR